MLSFTGSAKIGWQLKQNAGKMKVSLELGGNASCILTETADISVAVPRLVFGSFYANGKTLLNLAEDPRPILHLCTTYLCAQEHRK